MGTSARSGNPAGAGGVRAPGLRMRKFQYVVVTSPLGARRSRGRWQPVFAWLWRRWIMDVNVNADYLAQAMQTTASWTAPLMH